MTRVGSQRHTNKIKKASSYAELFFWKWKETDSSIESLHICVWVDWPPSVVLLASRRITWVWFQIRADLSSSPLCQVLLLLLNFLPSRTNWRFSREKMVTAWSLQLTFILCRGIVFVEVSFKFSYVSTPCMVLGQPYVFREVSKILKSEPSFVMSVRPSVCPHETTGQPIDEFWLNFISEHFSKIFRDSSSSFFNP